MVPVVTSATIDFLPGVIALRNSLERHWKDYSFHVLAYGDEIAERLDDEGIDYALNEVIPAKLPCSYKCETENPAMYSRLLIPDLFDAPRSLYLDADSIILKPMDNWVNAEMKDHPIGGTASWAPIAKEVIGSNKHHEYGIMSSVLVFDRDQWKKKGIFQKCLDAMKLEGQLHFKTVVQAVLQYVLDKDWHNFPNRWQVQGGHQTTPANIGSAYVLHFAGTNPWDEMPKGLERPHKEFTRNYWAQYA